MRKIRVAHLGIAHDHSAVTMECARKYPDVFEVVGVCEPDEATRAQFGSEPAYKDIPWLTEKELFSIKDLDAVLCEGHELRSVSDAQKCIDHGLHVHLDKPGGTSLPAFEHLLRSADEKGLTVQMGYMYRWNPAFRYVYNAVKEGRLGEITGVDGSFSVRHTPEKRRWLKQFPGGMMFYIGCHTIDMIMLLCGTPDSVTPFNHSSDTDNDGSIDSSFAVLNYPHCACTVRSNATEFNGYANRRLLVCGTKGTMDILPLECPTLIRETMLDFADDASWRDASRSVFPGFLPGRYDEMMLDFAAFVRGEKKNPYTTEYELALQRVLREACK